MYQPFPSPFCDCSGLKIHLQRHVLVERIFRAAAVPLRSPGSRGTPETALSTQVGWKEAAPGARACVASASQLSNWGSRALFTKCRQIVRAVCCHC